MAFTRDMRPGDWPDVHRIYRHGIDSGTATVLTECPEYDEWDRGHTEGLRFVAEEGGQVVGFIAALPISSKPAYSGVVEVSVYVDPARLRQGIGSALMHKMIDESESMGIWTLQSIIISDNLASIRLHEKCGFRIVGRREKIARDRLGEWRDTLLLERRSQVVI